MSDDPTPIRTLTYDSPLVDLEPGDMMPIRAGDGHRGDDAHFVTLREMNFDGNEIWLRVECSCGATFGGAFTRERLRISMS